MKETRALFLVALVLMTAIALAQTNPNLETGFKPYGSYDASKIDSVSLTNGNLTINIPILSYPQRGSLSYNVAIIYNNKNWRVMEHCNLQNPEDCSSKWMPNLTGYSVHLQSSADWFVTRTLDQFGLAYLYTASDYQGSSHLFMVGAGADPFHSGYQMLRAADGSGYTLSTNELNKHDNHLFDPIYIRDKHGNEFTSALNRDPNGNLIVNVNGTVTDSIGRTFPYGESGTDSTGCPANTVATMRSFPGPNGGTALVKTCYTSVNLKTSFGETDEYYNPITEYPLTSTGDFVAATILYDGTSWGTSPKWTFEYADNLDGTNYGDLTKITLPTGGSISYTWETQEVCNLENGMRPPAFTPASRLVTSRAVDDGNGKKTTIYGLGFNQFEGSSLVTDPMGNQALHSFAIPSGADGNGCGFFENQTVWKASDGTVLKTETTQYSVTSTGFDDASGFLVTESLPSVITATLPNGKVSQIQRDYVDADGTTGKLGSSSNKVPSGNVIEERVYDYGTGAPGALLKKTHYTYKAFQDTNFLNRNFLDRPASETVSDLSGQIAQTTYSYDGYSLQPSGVPSAYLDTTIGSVRGNVTSTTKWVGGTVGSLTSTTSYYDSGMPYQATDFGGHTTTYTYSPTYVGAYVTQTQLPTTHSPNTAAHAVSGAYDFNTGLLTSFTDQNGNSSTYVYDSLARMTSASFPGGGGATLSYPDFVTVELKKKVDGSKWTDEIALFDGVGRLIRKLAANGQASNPWDQVDTDYYGDGTVRFKSYPYPGTGLGSARSTVGDTFSYDGLQRVTQVLHSDGTSVDTTYTGAAVMTTDEGNGTTRVKKIAQSDALGRLKYLCEVTLAAQGGVGATPVACGLDIGGNGFLTSYGYDALGNLTSANQGGYAPRGFVYDGLSRLTSATNPESGTVTYTYTADGQVQTRKRPLPNQTLTDSSHQVTTTYTYDELHRGRTVTYNDGVTPAATFNYDESTVAGHPTGYAVGQMTSQTTAKTGEYYWNFDAMGRAQGRSQCTPRSCPLGTYYNFNYTYNLLGAATTVSLPNPSAPNNPIVLTDDFNSVGRLTSVTSNLSDANHPANLLSNVQYGPFGITSATIGGLVSQTLSYSQRGWLNGSTNIEPTGTSSPGTVTIGGTEHSQQQQIPGTQSIGSVTLSGTLQSKSGGQSPATAGTGSFTVSGSSTSIDDYCPPRGSCYTLWNSGTVTAIVNGTSYSVSYSKTSTPSGLASSLAGAISGGTWANATASGATVTLTAKTTGAATNYSLSSSCTYNANFGYCDYTANPSGSAMTGGKDATSTTIYDSGTTSVTINGQPVSTSWSGSSTTSASIATALAQAVNLSSTYAAATANGSVVNLTSKQTGAATNYTLSASSTYDTVNFTTPSFTATRSGATMTGGTDAHTNTIYDTGNVSVTVNGYTQQTTYGQNDTQSSVASNLAAAFNGDANSPVTASTNGATLTLTPKQSGSFTYSANSASTNGNFTGPSFTTAVSGGDIKTLYAFSIPSSGGFAGNGNILKSFDTVNGNWTYAYDDFNRLLTAATDNSSVNPGIGCKWQYDRFGNRLSQTPYNGNCFQDTTKSFTKNAASPADTDNRMDGADLYDAVGNTITLRNPNGNVTLAYDAESRVTSTGGGYSYIYDAAGRRVAKLLNSAIVSEYLLEGSNQVIELDGTGNAVHTNIYAGGKLLTTYQGGTTHFHFSDWLGNRRVQTNDPYQPTTCTNYPFGDGQICTGPPDATEHHFTGKERDTETGLDYFGARYYGSNMGRFSSPDPIFFQAEMLTDPQRFNLYSYVRNSPLTLIDPKGEAIELTGTEEERRKQLEALKNAVGKQAGAYLYENKIETTDANGNKTTSYYVGVYTNGPDGKGPSFGSINSASNALGNIISDSRVAQLNLAPSGTMVRDNEGNSARIGPIGSGGTPGATYIGQDGKMHVTLLDTSTTSPGQLPADYMSNRQPGSVDAGILSIHEFGHVAYHWGGFWRQLLDSSNASAVRLENDVRRLRDPNAPTRTQH